MSCLKGSKGAGMHTVLILRVANVSIAYNIIIICSQLARGCYILVVKCVQ